MLNISKIEIKKNETEWEVTPEYDGIACIVDSTELKTYDTQYGQKEKFRLIIEINHKQRNGKNFTVTTMPMTPSLHEKSALYKFCKDAGFDVSNPKFNLADLAGKFIKVIVEHVKVEDKTYANIALVRKAPTDATFEVTYEPRAKKEAVEAESE